jgi:hypothetical protein
MTTEASPKIIPMTDNLRAAVWTSDDTPNAAIIYFQAREAEEKICFEITTSAPILSHMWRLPQLKGGHWLTTAEKREENRYAIFIDKKFLDTPFIVGLELASGSDPRDHIATASVWDKSGADAQIIYIENPE